MSMTNPSRLTRIVFTTVLVLLAAGAAVYLYQSYMLRPWTRDGQVRALIVNITPRVDGNIVKVHVADNQFVRKGDPLLEIDPSQYQLAVQSAEVNLQQQRQDVATLEAAIDSAQATVEAITASLAEAQKESARARAAGAAVSAEYVDQRATAVEVAAAQLSEAQAKLAEAKQTLGAPGEDNVRIQAAKVALDRAKLDLAWATISAPSDGFVTNVTIEEGDYARVGTPLLAFVDSTSFWVSGYFMETQLRYINGRRSGDHHLDGAPGQAARRRGRELRAGHFAAARRSGRWPGRAGPADRADLRLGAPRAAGAGPGEDHAGPRGRRSDRRHHGHRGGSASMISRKDGASAVVGGTLPAPARPPPTTAGSEPAALAADQTLGFRLPHWLDPVSALIGLKTAVGVVIAQTVALWMDWSPTGATLAVLMLQQTYFGRTLARAVLRMLGALIGSVVGLLVLHLLVQERALMILTVSLLGGVIIYMQQGARHPYAWLFGGFSLMLLTFGNVDQPEGAFEAAVAWVSGNALGITVVLVMHGVLWPHTGERQFNALLQTILGDSARLFRLKIADLSQAPASSQEIGRIENALIEAMPQLRLALRIAGHETGRVAALRPDYELLIEEVQALVTLVITLGESLKICRQAPVVMAALERSGAAQQVVSILDTELQTLAGDVARGQLGAQAGSRDAPLSRVHALTDDLFEALRARQHDPMDMAALAAALAKMIELAMRVAAIQETLALQAQPHGIEVAGQRLRALTPRPLYLGLVSDRWRKAIATSLVIAGQRRLVDRHQLAGTREDDPVRLHRTGARCAGAAVPVESAGAILDLWPGDRRRSLLWDHAVAWPTCGSWRPS